MSDLAVINIETRKVQAYVSVGHGSKKITISLMNTFEHATGVSVSPAQAREIGNELLKHARLVEQEEQDSKGACRGWPCGVFGS